MIAAIDLFLGSAAPLDCPTINGYLVSLPISLSLSVALSVAALLTRDRLRYRGPTFRHVSRPKTLAKDTHLQHLEIAPGI